MSNKLNLDGLDKAILEMMQGDIPLTSRPYRDLADLYAVSEDEILKRIEVLKEKHVIRNINALLCHTKAGYTVNILAAWTATPQNGETEEEAFDRVGAILSESPNISHCYVRKLPECWDHPVFAMMHACSEEEMQNAVSGLQEALPTESVRLLRTVKGWKKTSVKYF